MAQADENFRDPRESVAFTKLTQAQIKALERYGKRIQIKKGDPVWEAGQPNLCMFVVLKGTLEIVDGRSQKPIASHPAGHFSGDIDVMSGRPAVVTALAGTDLELLEVQGDCVRSIVDQQPEVGDVILRAFLMRRSLLQSRTDIGPLIVGSRYSPDTLRIREFLTRNRYPYTWDDLEISPETTRTLQEFKIGEEDTPVVVLPDGHLIRKPTNAQLAEALGVSRPLEDKIYDLVVIGAGPAGLAAGVYGASEGLSTLLVDADGPGGQAGTSSRIENYMGFPLGLSGQDLADRAVAQVEKFGAQMMVPAAVTDLTCNPRGGHEVDIEGAGKVASHCVILAPGASYRKLDVDDMGKFEGRGIYYSATNVERILCSDSAVAVVGAGNSAGQAAVYMSQAVAHVYLVVRGDDLRKTMSTYLARRVEQSENITVLLNSEVCELLGEEFLQVATIVDRKTGKAQRRDIAGIFVMIGAVPHTDWLPDSIARDPKGFILTGQQVVQAGKWKLDRPPFFLETSCPGVFAAGDARSNSVKRVASAVGEGSMAVAFIHQYLSL